MKCETCINKSICKYADNTLDVNSDISEIHILQGSPIRVNIECSKWQSDKQGNILNRTNTIGTFNKWNR